MQAVTERLRGAVVGFIVAQFISAWISYPLCVLAILAYASSPLFNGERLRAAIMERVIRWTPTLFMQQPQKAPVEEPINWSIPITAHVPV